MGIARAGWRWRLGGSMGFAGGDGEEADATVRVGGARGYVDLRVGRGRSVDGG